MKVREAADKAQQQTERYLNEKLETMADFSKVKFNGNPGKCKYFFILTHTNNFKLQGHKHSCGMFCLFQSVFGLPIVLSLIKVIKRLGLTANYKKSSYL